ncbi:hypothetical protein Pla52n_47890 [Stieleria varia]|uniref:Uncharacterized protein n=1 Tax=Stieleria varia TaxID=2528005 RepID=A0A5C6AF90_9BACT|nr:hypothetical protein Pla52n_47890 [Stieleria varia]
MCKQTENRDSRPRVHFMVRQFCSAGKRPLLPRAVQSLSIVQSFIKFLGMQDMVALQIGSSLDACADSESDQRERQQNENGEDANDHHSGGENGRVIRYGRINRARHDAPNREEPQNASDQSAASCV